MQTKKVFLVEFFESFDDKVRNTGKRVILVSERKENPNSCV